MNYLASTQQEVNPINLTISLVDNKPKQQLMQAALLKSVLPLLTNDKEREQFLQQLQATDLMSFQSTTTINKESDNVWLAEVEQQVTASLTAFEFTLDRLSRLIYLSPRQIRRRLKRLTGKTFSQYLKEARLNKAYNLLINREIKSVKKLAYQVGLKDVKYFSRQFKVHYGDVPSAFLA